MGYPFTFFGLGVRKVSIEALQLIKVSLYGFSDIGKKVSL